MAILCWAAKNSLRGTNTQFKFKFTVSSKFTFAFFAFKHLIPTLPVVCFLTIDFDN